MKGIFRNKKSPLGIYPVGITNGVNPNGLSSFKMMSLKVEILSGAAAEGWWFNFHQPRRLCFITIGDFNSF